MKSIQKYLKQQLYLHQAKQWLKVNDATAIAAHCLFHLNRLARNGGGDRPVIYALKNEMVRLLYLQGYCYHVSEQYQRFECWSCGGTGDYWDDGDCWKCGGTGVYRSYRLYQFYFRIGNRRYSWHQPFSLVDWPVVLTQETMGEYERGNGQRVELSWDLEALYLMTVYQFLIDRGVPAEELPSLLALRKVIQQDLKRLWLATIKRKWRELKESEMVVNGRRLWRFLRTGEMPEKYEIIDDEIPF